MTSQPKPTKIHVTASKRGFGLGFGANHQVAVYTEERPKTGALLTEEQCFDVALWAKTGDRQRITDFIEPKDLVGALHNRLIHADMIELVRILPKMLDAMMPSDRAVLFDEPISRIAPEMWEELAQTRPRLRDQRFDAARAHSYFKQLARAGFGKHVATGGEDIQFNGVSMEASATILPMLFESLDKNSQVQITRIMAEALHEAREDKAFFGPLADVNLNRLTITHPGTGSCEDIINNGRTIMIRSSNGPQVKFQGEVFTSSNLHFHPLKNADPAQGPVMNTANREDAKPEFVRYQNAVHKAWCLKHHADPHPDVVGQLHAIFTAKGKRALLLGADVKVGDYNEEMGKYIDLLKAKKAGRPLEIINDTSDPAEVAAKAVPAAELAFNPLAAFKGRFDVDGVPVAPFMSLHLGGLKVDSLNDVGLKEGKSSVFYRGVQVIHLPDSITISKGQLSALRELQPVLMEVDEATCVHPQPRSQPAIPRWRDIAKTESFTQRGL